MNFMIGEVYVNKAIVFKKLNWKYQYEIIIFNLGFVLLALLIKIS